MHPRLPLATALLVALSACAKSAPPATQDAPASAPAARTDAAPAPAPTGAPPLLRDMVDHYGVMTEARDLLIRGDVAGANERLTWVATHEVNPALPADLQMFAYQMKRDAGQVRLAGNAGQTAEALANAVASCGACHAAAEVSFDLRAGAPPEGTDVASHMARHLWVAQRFWDALIMPSDAAWSEGIDALAADALHAAEVPHAADRAAAVDAMAKLVHDLGIEAEQTRDRAERAAVVGALYATCADCHGERNEAN